MRGSDWLARSCPFANWRHVEIAANIVVSETRIASACYLALFNGADIIIAFKGFISKALEKMATAKKKPENEEGSEAKPAKKKRTTTGNVVMSSAVAGALVSVGVWIAQDFFDVKVPAQMAAPLATVVLWLATIGRVIALGIAAIVITVWELFHP